MVLKHTAHISHYHFYDAEKTACDLLDILDDTLKYHRKEHTTESVLLATLKLAEKEGLPLEKRLLSAIAALFHDTGYVKEYLGNEPIGAAFAEKYMKESQCDYTQEHITDVKKAIINTNMKLPPQTVYEKILRDADIAYVGLDDSRIFLQWIKDLQEESDLHPQSPFYERSQNDQLRGVGSLNFFTRFHKRYTQSGKILYEDNKQKNIIALKQHYQL